MPTSPVTYDVVGLGSAIVDVLSFVDEEFLTQQKLTKGSMTLVDEIRSAQLYSKLGPSTECSGGSVANTMAGLASLGARGAFIGKVRDDQLGSIFIHDMHAVGVHYSTPAAKSGPTTASCLVCVTSDAQRTMATYIGACTGVTVSDMNEDIIRSASTLYIEGYLWDIDEVKEAIRHAMRTAREAGRKIAFTLSDMFCVDRHREEFLQLINGEIDIVFANEGEIKSLYQTDDADAAFAKIRGRCPIAVVTRGEHGSVVITEDKIEAVSTVPVKRVVDTTGAGDLYASGFLYGLSRNWDLVSCADLGNRCAGEIITQLGARSMRPLGELVA